MRRLSTFVFLLCALLSRTMTAAAEGEPAIRVAIMKGLTTLDIRARNLVIRDLKTFEKIQEYPSSIRIAIAAAPQGIAIGGAARKTDHLSVSTTGPVLWINGKTYRGKLEIARDANGTLTIINELSMEKYLVGLINHEISSQWNMEAIKAQAVVARTYALFQRAQRQEDFYDLESTVLDQVYGGSVSEDERSLRGVQETRGIVLMYRQKIIRALYHSSCGGHTEASINFTGEDLPYLRGVSCPFCKNAPNFFWVYSVPLSRIAKVLSSKGIPMNKITGITVARRSLSNRALEFAIATDMGRKIIAGEALRKYLGYDRMKGLIVRVDIKNNEAVFMGSGAGHGVGLCQWGMKGMADRGYDYSRILSFYYPGTELRKIY